MTKDGIVGGLQVETAIESTIAVTVATLMILGGIKAVIDRIGGIKSINQESIGGRPPTIAETANTAESKLLIQLILLVDPTPQIQTVTRRNDTRRTLAATKKTTTEGETKNVLRTCIHTSKRKS